MTPIGAAASDPPAWSSAFDGRGSKSVNFRIDMPAVDGKRSEGLASSIGRPQRFERQTKMLERNAADTASIEAWLAEVGPNFKRELIGLPRRERAQRWKWFNEQAEKLISGDEDRDRIWEWSEEVEEAAWLAETEADLNRDKRGR